MKTGRTFRGCVLAADGCPFLEVCPKVGFRGPRIQVPSVIVPIVGEKHGPFRAKIENEREIVRVGEEERERVRAYPYKHAHTHTGRTRKKEGKVVKVVVFVVVVVASRKRQSVQIGENVNRQIAKNRWKRKSGRKRNFGSKTGK